MVYRYTVREGGLNSRNTMIVARTSFGPHHQYPTWILGSNPGLLWVLSHESWDHGYPERYKRGIFCQISNVN